VAVTNSMESGGKSVTPRGPNTMGDYTEHMREFSASGGLLLGEAATGNTTHSLLSSNSGMPKGMLAKPSMGSVTLPPAKY
jgi:hypothetical protein